MQALAANREPEWLRLDRNAITLPFADTMVLRVGTG
jgi:hypothetical protein